MRSLVVGFTGYRPEKMPMGGDESSAEIILIKQNLHRDVLNVVYDGYTHFITGMAVGWDLWAGEAVADIRDTGSEITLEAAIPFRAQGNRLKGRERERYFALLDRVDVKTFVSEGYSSGVFHKRNRYIVDSSSLLICYYDGKPGGTAYTVDYAEKNGLRIINIAANR